jgi:hypothetical protein
MRHGKIGLLTVPHMGMAPLTGLLLAAVFNQCKNHPESWAAGLSNV